jgi:hypothetical protein
VSYAVPMRTWLLRGVVLAVVHAVAETARADFGVHHPTDRTLFESILLGVLVAVSAVWAAVDVWREVPERGKTWLIASLIAGWGSAVLGVIGKAVFVDQTGVADLSGALTGGAAFTALTVLISAGIGLLVGKGIASAQRAEASDEDDESADEDEDEPEPAQRGGGTSPGPRS